VGDVLEKKKIIKHEFPILMGHKCWRVEAARNIALQDLTPNFENILTEEKADCHSFIILNCTGRA